MPVVADAADQGQIKPEPRGLENRGDGFLLTRLGPQHSPRGGIRKSWRDSRLL